MRFIERWAVRPNRSQLVEGLVRSCHNSVLAIPEILYLGPLLINDGADGLPANSHREKLGKLLGELEKEGAFIPNNFNLLGKRVYPRYFRDRGIPMPNFEILESGSLSEKQIVDLSSSSSGDYPSLFLVKPTESHRGENIRVVTGEDLRNIRSTDTVLIVQNFWWPKKEAGYIRDIRVVTIDGEPVALCAREAKDPLVDSCGNLIEYPPNLSRVLANVVRGGRVTEVKPDLRDDLFCLARKTCQGIREYAIDVRKYMGVENPQMVNLGLIAVDILDGDSGLAVCEVDTDPGLSFFPNSVSRLIARRYADYFISVSRAHKNPILVFDWELMLRKELIKTPVDGKSLIKRFRAKRASFVVALLKENSPR